jgi:hypothetical protein
MTAVTSEDTSEPVSMSFFDALRPGGFYVIEDLGCAFDPRWEGGPPGLALTGIDLVKQQVDEVHRRYWNNSAPGVKAVHLYDQIVFIEKA